MKKHIADIIICTALIVIICMPVWSYLVPDKPLTVSETETAYLYYANETIEVEIPEDYVQLWTLRIGLPIRVSQLIDEDDPVAQSVAKWIQARYPDIPDWRKAVIAANIVKTNMNYVRDDFDHWNLPWETLRDGKGDCEDYSIMLCSILRALGMDAVLLIELNHACVGVALEDFGAKYYYTSLDGTKYYYINVTSANIYPGEYDGDAILKLSPGWNWCNMLEFALYLAVLYLPIHVLYKVNQKRNEDE